jgi:hypothetical protein
MQPAFGPVASGPRPSHKAATGRENTINGVTIVSNDEWTLYPPPQELTPTWTPDIWPDRLLLMNACVKYGVKFRWSLGVLCIQLSDIEVVLNDLPDHIRVLGFDTFRLEGYSTCPRLDYYSEYGHGISVAEALADIADWPRDMELWIQAVITDEHRK